MRIKGAAVLEPASSIQKASAGVDSGGMEKKCVSTSRWRKESTQVVKACQMGIPHTPEAIKNPAPIIQNCIVRQVPDVPLSLAACFDPQPLSFM